MMKSRHIQFFFLLLLSLSCGVQKKMTEGERFKLDDFPDYAEDLSPTSMRIFLQNAINYASSNNGVLVFPSNKTFLISIPEGIPERKDYTHCGGDGLVIPGNIEIDLNGSTIKCTTNDFYSYKIVHIPSTSNNVTLRNGYIVGDRESHIIPSDLHPNKKSAEWNHALCIDACDNVLIDNLNVSSVRGDGIQESGAVVWNHVHPIKPASFETGRIGPDGSKLTSKNDLLSPLLSISQFYSLPQVEPSLTSLMIRSTCDRQKSNYEFSYHISVAYFDAGEKYISQEIVDVGTALRIPLMAEYLRFSFWIANPNEMNDDWWITAFAELTNSTVRNCEIHHCGRNGMVPGVCSNVFIDSCYIHDIGGTNNEVGIDVEGTSFIQGGVEICNCIVERCKSSLVMPQGRNIIVRGCRLGDVFGGSENILIEDCDIAANLKLYSQESKHFRCQEIFPSSVVRRCRIGGAVYVFNGKIEDCEVSGGAVYNASRMFHTDEYLFPQKCYRCTFSSHPDERMQVCYAEFYDCKFMTKKSEDGGTYQICLLQPESEIRPFVFNGCKFWGSISRSSMGKIAVADFINCEIHGRNCDIAVASNKIIGNKFYSSSELNTAAFRIQPYGENPLIENNLFSVEDINQTKHFYYCGLIIDESYFKTLPIAKSVTVRSNVFRTQGELSRGLINAGNASQINIIDVSGNILDPYVKKNNAANVLELFVEQKKQL